MLAKPISLPRVYRYLNLKTFTREEMENVFDQIALGQHDDSHTTNLRAAEEITVADLNAFLVHRIQEMEDDSEEQSPPEAEFLRQQFAQAESRRVWQALFADHPTSSVDKSHFVNVLQEKAAKVDLVRSLPIISSMLIVGASVGVITPAMPFVVENLGLNAGQYGLVVSAFALSKMAANIPTAIFVERHGRKPFAS